MKDQLIEYIRQTYNPDEKRKTSKDGSFTDFFRKAGKSLCYVETSGGYSRLVIVIGTTLTNKVQSSELSSKTKKLFNEAKQYHDGKWLIFEINEETYINDIKILLSIKRPPK